MPAVEIARGFGLAAIALTVGAFAFAALAWLPALRESFARAEGDAEHAGLHEGCDAFFARLALLSAAASLAGLAAALLILATDELEATRERVAWALAAVAFLLLAAAAWRAPRGRDLAYRSGPVAAAAAGSLALLLVPGVSGNAAGEDPAALLVAANAIHVGAASVWTGGIACLLLAVPAGLAAPRRPAPLLAAVAERFSAIALLAVVALALSGVVQGLVLVGRIEALVTTGYGRLVLIKGALLCALALAGAMHRGRSLPALRSTASLGAANAAMRRLLGAEAVLLALVFIATAALAATTPAAAEKANGSARATGQIGASRLVVTARPGRPGLNEMTIELSGSAPARLTASARQRRLGIGPVALSVTRVAPGRFKIPRASLPAPGTWEITLTTGGGQAARVSLRLR